MSPPQAPLPRDKPRFALSSHQRKEIARTWRFFISGRFLTTICTSRYQKMYIKSYHNQDLGIKEVISHRKSLESGLHSAWWESLQSTTKPTQRCWNSFQGWIFWQTNLLINDQASTATPWPSCYNTHFLCNNTKLLTNWQEKTLAHVSLLLLDHNSNLWTPNLAIFTLRNVWLFQMFTKTKHHSKTQKLEGDNGDGPFPPFFDSGFIFLILILCCIALISGITTSD